MVDVVQINAADGEIAELFDRGCAFDVGQDGSLRFESEWNKPTETTGLVLELAQLTQVIDALLERFDVAVKHGAGAAASHSMPGPMHIQPLRGCFFAAADLITHLGVENFRAPAGDRAQSILAQKVKRVPDRHFENSLREMPDLDRSESFNMKIRVESAQSAKKVQIPLFLETGMESPDHMNFCDSERQGIRDRPNNFVGGMLKSMGVTLLRGKGAKLTREHADVRVIDVAIVNVSRKIAVFSFPHHVGHHAERV